MIIGISGTNGKSTTTHISYELFKQIFSTRQKDFQIHISGNFGTPLSQTLSEIIKQSPSPSLKHIIIIECSSFMLYQLKDFNFDYSILTNIETDHLDRHPNKKDYAETKINIIKFTTQQSFTTQKVYDKLDTKLQNKTEIFGYDYDLS
ncbi:MAG: hypothetical protein GXP45_00550 [bacterium]|nr:hypothetical protein [bacterium]